MTELKTLAPDIAKAEAAIDALLTAVLRERDARTRAGIARGDADVYAMTMGTVASDRSAAKEGAHGNRGWGPGRAARQERVAHARSPYLATIFF